MKEKLLNSKLVRKIVEKRGTLKQHKGEAYEE